jgi:hypothetical protein
VTRATEPAQAELTRGCNNRGRRLAPALTAGANLHGLSLTQLTASASRTSIVRSAWTARRRLAFGSCLGSACLVALFGTLGTRKPAWEAGFQRLRGKDSNLDYLIQSQASYH